MLPPTTAFKDPLNKVLAYAASTFQDVKPAAIQCLQLIPIYWIFCLAHVSTHITVSIISVSIYFGWCCVQYTISMVELSVLQFNPDRDLWPKVIETIISKTFKSPNRNESIITLFWWIRLLSSTSYIIWATYKSWHILSMVRGNCAPSHSSQQTTSHPPPYHSHRSSPGPRLMVLGAVSAVPDDLRPDSANGNVFHLPPTPPQDRGERKEVDELPWGRWDEKN